MRRSSEGLKETLGMMDRFTILILLMAFTDVHMQQTYQNVYYKIPSFMIVNYISMKLFNKTEIQKYIYRLCCLQTIFYGINSTWNTVNVKV